MCVMVAASWQVVLDRSHPEFLGGTKLTSIVGELQAMCCAVLWLIEQNRIDASMRLEIRFGSKYAAAAAVGTQRCSSNTELVHKLRYHWQCVDENTFGGVGMTQVRGHKVDPWNEMADSLAEAAMNGCVVPSSRTELEKWMLSFRGVPVAATLGTCCEMPPGVKSGRAFVRKQKNYLCLFVNQKKLKSLRIATLNVLTLGPAEEREANGLRIPARQSRLASTFQEAGIEIIGLQECRLHARHDHVWS